MSVAKTTMNVLAFGGGTNSTAVLVGWHERGLQPIDAILFADTGNEKPHTYKHIAALAPWLKSVGMPPITVVKKGGRAETLEENCLRMNMLPSLAYGFNGCSHKYKIEPQEKFLNNWPPSRDLFKAGGKVTKLIGYDFAEERRWAKAKLEDEKYVYRFPLVEWEWSRAECVAAIARAGIALPGKSACFFCPASTKPEIDDLKKSYPLLFHRALALEDNAKQNLDTVKGLGRRFAWRDYAATKETPDALPCMVCVDG